jgi:hypothetical protein
MKWSRHPDWHRALKIGATGEEVRGAATRRFDTLWCARRERELRYSVRAKTTKTRGVPMSDDAARLRRIERSLADLEADSRPEGFKEGLLSALRKERDTLKNSLRPADEKPRRR